MLELILGFDRIVFPEADCNVPSSHEKNVRNSTATYVCALWNPRIPLELLFATCTPYVSWAQDSTYEAAKSEEKLLYCWLSVRSADIFYAHKENPVNLDNDRVIAWKAVSVENWLHDFTSEIKGEFHD